MIHELVAAEGGLRQVFSCASWSPSSRSRGFLNVPTCARAVWRLRRTSASGTKGVVHVHLSEKGSFLREGFLLAWAALIGSPTVATLHGADFPTFAEKWPRLVKQVLCRSDVVLALGPKTKELVLRLIPDQIVAETLNPVSLPDLDLTAEHKLCDGKYVLFAGEMSRRKGLDRLLLAWREVAATAPDFQLILCGPPADVTVDPSLSGVRVLGQQPRQRTLSWIRGASLVCLPSRREVLPMTLLEAAIHGVPTLATDVGEIAVLRASGGIAIVSPEPEAIASAISELLLHPGRRQAMGSNNAVWARRHASADAVSRSLERAYEIAAQTRSTATGAGG